MKQGLGLEAVKVIFQEWKGRQTHEVPDKRLQSKLGPAMGTGALHPFSAAAAPKHRKPSDFSNRSFFPRDLEAGLTASEGLSSLTRRRSVSPSGAWASVLLSPSEGTATWDYRPP